MSPNSRSRLLCRDISRRLTEKGVDVHFLDASDMDLRPHWKGKSSDMQIIAEAVEKADNIIFGMGVHAYSINDSLKLILDNCMAEATGKFFGILCAAGGEHAYLSTMHLTQICMNEWRMIQLPRTVYAVKKDFTGQEISSLAILERLQLFADEFYKIGTKLC